MAHSIKNSEKLSALLDAMVRARVIDEIEQEYTARGEAFFHVSGAGHEGIAALGPHLREDDYLHAHYRDKSLLLYRGVPSSEYFLALFNKDASNSRGRQMNAHMSSPAHRVLSIVGPVGNNALQAAGVAAHAKEEALKVSAGKKTSSSITLCALGEGTTQQGEFLEALTLSIRDNLPVLFLIEDNKYAISTHTQGKTFYQVGDRQINDFLGCPIDRIDGRYPHGAYEAFERITREMRENGGPRIVIFSVERLASHTNADDQKIYRSAEDIQAVKISADPIVNLIMHLHGEDAQHAQTRFEELCAKAKPALRKEAQDAQRSAEPKPVFTAKPPLAKEVISRAKKPFEPGSLTMIDAMREVLDEWLTADPRVFLYGEDIEDPKGDVFGLTRGLSTKYLGRVVNSPLSESLIVGTAIGRALAGSRPVAFLQFADFFPLAFNQIYSELGSMYWRTDGRWSAPVIVLATCGGYRPGLGPFHASVMESVAAHTPGIDVMMPSNAADAAGLLNAAFLSQRPTVFFYPKNRLNAQAKTITAESARKYVVVPGTADVVREGADITLAAYGNTVPLCEKAAETLALAGKSAEIIDVRSMSPLDDATIRGSALKTGRLLVTHEDTLSVSMSSEIIARVLEHPDAAGRDIACARVAREDTYVPCNFENQLEVLPSYKRIVESAVQLLGGEVAWTKDADDAEGFATIFATGSSPSDEQLTVMKWNIKQGDVIAEGDLIAEGEADKAACDIKASASGVVEELYAEEGDTVAIGKPLVRVNISASGHRVVRTVTREESGTAQIRFTSSSAAARKTSAAAASPARVCMGYVRSVLGSRVVDNEELVQLSPEWTQEKILMSTGIESRHWVGENQTLESMTCEAARMTLAAAGISLSDVSGIVCATGTHEYQTPSLAAMVQHRLASEEAGQKSSAAGAEADPAPHYNGYAYDVSAACSGYLFAISDAYHRVLHNPAEVVLVLTGEVLSKRIDMKDYGTAPVFSDAASATIIASEEFFARRAAQKKSGAKNAQAAGSFSGALRLAPLLQTIGEPARDLTVPEVGCIQMNGVEVYKVAVAQLAAVAREAIDAAGLSFDDIDLIVPHQANLKIINGVARRLKISPDKFYKNIAQHGNSSSNTIPICLHELDGKLSGKKVLLIAFGGGYTFGGAVVDY